MRIQILKVFFSAYLPSLYNGGEGQDRLGLGARKKKPSSPDAGPLGRGSLAFGQTDREYVPAATLFIFFLISSGLAQCFMR